MDESLRDALRTLRAADELRAVLPRSSRDRALIETDIQALDSEISRQLRSGLEGARRGRIRALADTAQVHFLEASLRFQETEPGRNWRPRTWPDRE
jgi:hypothetical protein